MPASYLVVCEKYPPFEVVNVPVSISHSFDDLYSVILSLHKTIGHVIVKVIKNLISPIPEHRKPSSKFLKPALANRFLPIAEGDLRLSTT